MYKKDIKLNQMGKMKELFMETRMHHYEGDNDPHIQELANQSIEEFIFHMEDVPCPNCNQIGLIRNKDEGRCEYCAQEFVFIDKTIRFK